jgi:hypothetical protein
VEEITIGTGLSLSSGTLSNTFTGITSIGVTAPIATTGGSTPTISIGDAAADGTTKGAATFTASDFNSTSGLISIDYTNGQAATSGTKGFLTASDWTTFNSKQDAISFSTTGSSGAATFIANALNIPDYTLVGLGGQPQLNGTGFVKATGTTISYDNSTYLTSAITSLNTLTGATQTFANDTNVTITSAGTTHTLGWTGTLADSRISSAATWNAKQNAITLTTTGTSGAATFIGNTLNIPQYASGGGQNLQSVTNIGNITTNDLLVERANTAYVSTRDTVTGREAYIGVETFGNSGVLGLGNGAFTNLLFADLPTSGRTYQLPNASGTLVVSVNNQTADTFGNVNVTNTWVLTGGFTGTTLTASTTFCYGQFYNSTAIDLFNARDSRRIYVAKSGFIKSVVIMTSAAGFSSVSPPNSMQIQIVKVGGSTVTIDASYSMSSGAFSGNSRQNVYTGLNFSVTSGEWIEIRLVCPAWGTAPTGVNQIINIYFENL